MRTLSLSTAKSGIDRLRVKGGASASSFYDLVNAYITMEGTVVPRAGTTRDATLDDSTAGLTYFDEAFNIFSNVIEGGQILADGFQITAATLDGDYVGYNDGDNASYPPAGGAITGSPLANSGFTVSGFWSDESYRLYLILSGTAAAPQDLYSSLSSSLGEIDFSSANYSTYTIDSVVYTEFLWDYEGLDYPFTAGDSYTVSLFSASTSSVPEGYAYNVLTNPNNLTDPIEYVWFAKPFMGFLYVVAEFESGDVVHYWLQSSGAWAADTVYLPGTIVEPTVPNGLAYQAVRLGNPNPVWAPSTGYTSASIVEPSTANGYMYVVADIYPTEGATSGATEPTWPTGIGATVFDYGNYQVNQLTLTSTSTSALSTNITNKYGNTNIYADGAVGSGPTMGGLNYQTNSASAATQSNPITPTGIVSVWTGGTLYQPGAMVIPSTNQGAVTGAIPNGDFANGDDGSWTLTGNWTIGELANPFSGWEAYSPPAKENATITQATSIAAVPGANITATCMATGGTTPTAIAMSINLVWYASDGSIISTTTGGYPSQAPRNAWFQLSVTGVAPADTTSVAVQIHIATGTADRDTAGVTMVQWNFVQPSPATDLIYVNEGTTAATSGYTEPTWPDAIGDTVTDGGVTWTAIGSSVIEWQAVPICLSSEGIQYLGIQSGSDTAASASGYNDGTVTDVGLTPFGAEEGDMDISGVGTVNTLVAERFTYDDAFYQRFCLAITGASTAPEATAITGITFTDGAGNLRSFLTANVNNVLNPADGYLASGTTAIWVWDAVYSDSTYISFTDGNDYVFSVTGPTIGGSEPAWPTTIGGTVGDGVSGSGQFSWTCISRAITDPNCPNTKSVLIGASKIYAINGDIVNFSATTNPTDWTSANDAGYLPTGMQQYGSNPAAVLSLYRGNLMVFNSEGYQMWQIDPDPANMALLDAEPVGAIATLCMQPVANDLLFLAAVGVRNVGINGATGNLYAGTLGQPVDALIQAELAAGTYQPISVYYPARGQYWLIFGPTAYVLTVNGTSQRSWSRYVFPEPITYATLNGEDLYLRTSNNVVWLFDDTALQDDVQSGSAVPFTGILWWPWLDAGTPGHDKSVVGFDLAGTGEVNVSVGYNQNDTTAFTDDYYLAVADTIYGYPTALPVAGKSFSLYLEFLADQAWQLSEALLYINDW